MLFVRARNGGFDLKLGDSHESNRLIRRGSERRKCSIAVQISSEEDNDLTESTGFGNGRVGSSSAEFVICDLAGS